MHLDNTFVEINNFPRPTNAPPFSRPARPPLFNVHPVESDPPLPTSKPTPGPSLLAHGGELAMKGSAYIKNLPSLEERGRG